MINITQDGEGIVNTKNIIGFYIGDCRIYAVVIDKSEWQLGTYNNKVDTHKAFDLLKIAMSSKERVFNMPSRAKLGEKSK